MDCFIDNPRPPGPTARVRSDSKALTLVHMWQTCSCGPNNPSQVVADARVISDILVYVTIIIYGP